LSTQKVLSFNVILYIKTWVLVICRFSDLLACKVLASLILMSENRDDYDILGKLTNNTSLSFI